MKIQYIRKAENVLADCLSRLVNAKLTDCNYEPKGQEFGCTIFKELPLILNTDKTTDVCVIKKLQWVIIGVISSYSLYPLKILCKCFSLRSQ